MENEIITTKEDLKATVKEVTKQITAEVEKTKADLEAKSKELEKALAEQKEMLEKREKELAEKTAEVEKKEADKVNPYGTFIDLKKEEKTHLFGSYIKSLAYANLKRISPVEASGIFKDAMKTESMDYIHQKLSSGVLEEGGILLDPEISNEFIELLTFGSIMRNLPVTKWTMNSASMEVKKESTGSGASWVGETGTAVTKSSQKFGKYTLTPKKLRGWSALPNDWINDMNMNAVQMIENSMIRAMIEAEELAFVNGTGSAYQPKGLSKWTSTANQFDIGGTTAELIETDLFSLEEKIHDAKIKGDLYFLMPFRTYSALRTKLRATSNAIAFPELRNPTPTLLGHKVIINDYISKTQGGGTETQIFLFQPQEFVIADRLGLDIKVNPPQNDSNYPQDVDETLILVTERLDTFLKHSKACSILTAVTY